MLDQAIASLKDYDWGEDKTVLQPIEEAVVATHGNADERKKLESSLAAVLKTTFLLTPSSMFAAS